MDRLRTCQRFIPIWVILVIITMNPVSSVAHEGHAHNRIHDINLSWELYKICKNDIEGYSRTISGGEYTYPSMREDVEKALISRASTGKMSFEIETAIVPLNYKGENVNFFYISDLDLNLRKPFDIKVNGKHLLTFKANEDGTLHKLNAVKGADVKYYITKRDVHGDGIGAFRLTVPVNMIKKGEKAKVWVCGQNKGSNSWFMLFKAKDVISRLTVSNLKEVSFEIKQFGDMLLIDVPEKLAGTTVSIISDGKDSKKVRFKKQGDLAKASVKAVTPKNNFKIKYGDDIFEAEFPKSNGVATSSTIKGKFFYYYKTSNHHGWRAVFTKLYRPSFYEAYDNFFTKRYQNGLVSIMNSSHQDIAWVDRPEVCIILRDTLLLSPIIRDAFARNDYGFDIEDGLMLREYIERHPDSKQKITTLLNKKLLSVGATYNCPYEDMYDAEDQVRQLYLGKKWVKKNFGGYDSKVYWNVDVPGKSLQTPQILKKAGVDYMIISRHARGLFHWKSPDGSSVFTYSPGHYGEDLLHLNKDLSSKLKYSAEQVVEWDRFYDNSKNHTPILSSQDMLPAIDYSEMIETWNNTKSIKDSVGNNVDVYFPHMELMTVDEYMPLAEKHANNADTIYGERPNVWVYIHGPSHHYAQSASREASKLIPAAEKFMTAANLIDSKKMPYPYNEIEEAWLSKIYPDHGWGGHDGDITDNLFKENFIRSRNIGEKLLNRSTQFLAGRVKTKAKKGTPVVLFNSLSWERTDPVSVKVEYDKGEVKGVSVFDASKKIIKSQLKNVVRFDDNSIKSAEVVFIAENISSIGYKTYYLKTDNKEPKQSYREAFKNRVENGFYTVEFADGGVKQIYDKELKRNLFNSDNLLAGEVFTMKSVGNGAGEFGDVQQPTMESFDKVSLHNCSWEMVDSGDVFTTYRLRQQIKHAIVEQDVTVYNKLKRVLFETKLLNWSGEMFREFRTAFPVDINNAHVAHEVPFGTVRVGKDEIKTAGERYTPLCKDVHPRAIVDWFSASDDDISVTLSSSVAAVDWIDPTNDNSNTILQHILLASRTSCHWEGNEYSQAGNHYYNNIVTSNKPDDMSGIRVAKQQNEPLVVVYNPEKSSKASLKESNSFFRIDADNIMITAIKKAEDSDDVVFRMYDLMGKRSVVKLDSYFKSSGIYKTNIIEENPVKTDEIVVPEYSIETFMVNYK